MKSLYETLLGKNEFVVLPKVFGYALLHCFVRDHRPSIGKLDPQATDAYLLATHHDKNDIDLESIQT